MNTRPPIILRQRRDFGQTIGDSFAFMRQNWKPIMKALAGVSLLPMLIGLAVMGGMGYMAYTTIASGGGQGPEAVFGSLFGVLAVVLMIVLFVYAGVMMEALTHEYFRAYERGEHVGMTTGELRHRCHGQFWSYFGIQFLTGIATVVGAVLCYLPGIWIAIAFILSPIAHGEERLGATGSMGRSFKLVHKSFWGTLGLVFVMSLIIGAIQMACFLPFYFVAIFSFIAGMQGGEFPIVAAIVGGIGYIVLIVVSFFLIPLFRVSLGLQYYNLVEQFEGKGLQDRLQNLGTV